MPIPCANHDSAHPLRFRPAHNNAGPSTRFVNDLRPSWRQHDDHDGDGDDSIMAIAGEPACSSGCYVLRPWRRWWPDGPSSVAHVAVRLHVPAAVAAPSTRLHHPRCPHAPHACTNPAREGSMCETGTEESPSRGEPSPSASHSAAVPAYQRQLTTRTATQTATLYHFFIRLSPILLSGWPLAAPPHSQLATNA